MKFFTTSKIALVDQDTLLEEGIKSIDLMERAASRLLEVFKRDIDKDRHVYILAGPGNNGGDGLALGRMMLQEGYEVQVFFLHEGRMSDDCRINFERLRGHFSSFVSEDINKLLDTWVGWGDTVIDALFGSGLSRPLEGIYAQAVKWLYEYKPVVYSIDIPSGLQGEACAREGDLIVRAVKTYTLQFPKLALLLPENEEFVGKFEIVDIDLHPLSISSIPSNFYYNVTGLLDFGLIKRNHFSHKGTFGHMLLWAGQKGMAGAALLAARAALRNGVGLLSVHSEEDNRTILQTALPEAIFLNEVKAPETFSACAFGPGLGTGEATAEKLTGLLEQLKKPCVLDADALNILAERPEMFELIPEDAVLTPHPKEFDRMFGSSANSLERIDKARDAALKYQIYILIKGAHSVLVSPNGWLYFNSTGNSGMAVGGMGDVLTGMIGAMLAQGYNTPLSVRLAMWLHGRAADLALDAQSPESLLPSDVIEYLGKAHKEITFDDLSPARIK